MTQRVWRSRITGHDSVDPRTLIGNPKNHRIHPQKQRDVVADSISELGFVKSVLVNRTTGYVIDGHERLWHALAAVEKDESVLIDVEYVELSEAEEAKALALLDASSEMAEVDPEALDALLREFETSSESIADMLTELAEAAGTLDRDDSIEDIEPEIDKADVLMEEWGTAEGQIWIIEGKQTHRLLCGDSSKAEDVGRLMDGASADMLLTDPPYGVSYVGKTKDALKVENDDCTDAELRAMIKIWFDRCFEVTRPGAYWYATVPAGAQLAGFFNDWIERGVLRQGMVWVKDSMVLGHSEYHYRHETIIFGWKPDGKRHKNKDRTRTTVFEVPRPKASREHPTMKPIELWAMMMRDGSRKNEIVYEPFSGSGTTHLTAEQLKRKCYGIEISPQYVAVILQRMKAAGCECRLEQNA